MKIFLQLLLVLTIAYFGPIRGQETDQKVLKRINEHLSKAVSTDDIPSNLVELTSWLEKLKQQKTKCIAFRCRSNDDTIKSLEHLFTVKSATDETNCNEKNRELVNKLDRAVGLPRLNLKRPMNGIYSKIIYHYAKKYYDSCYPNLLRPIFEELSAESGQHLSAIAKIEIPIYSKKLGAKQYVRYLRELSSTGPSNHDLGDAGQSQTIGQRIALDEYRDHLVQPCKELNAILRGEHYNKAWYLEYDLDMNERNRRTSQSNAVEHCHFILENEDKIWQHINEYFISEEKQRQEEEYRRSLLKHQKLKEELEALMPGQHSHQKDTVRYSDMFAALAR